MTKKILNLTAGFATAVLASAACEAAELPQVPLNDSDTLVVTGTSTQQGNTLHVEIDATEVDFMDYLGHSKIGLIPVGATPASYGVCPYFAHKQGVRVEQDTSRAGRILDLTVDLTASEMTAVKDAGCAIMPRPSGTPQP